jgi:hypothetical protein
MNEIVITPLVIPADADAPGAEEFRAMVELGNRMASEDAGIDDLADAPAQLLPGWQDQTDRIRRGFVARRDGEIVGASALVTAAAEGTTAADISLMVPPSNADAEAERLLLERVEEEARSLKRSVLQLWSLHPATHGPRTIAPRTGWGEVTPTRLSELAAAHGYGLEQVERNSVLALDGSFEQVEQMRAEAEAFASTDYRVVTWTLPTPEHLRAGYAGMIARMATDIPSGDLEYDEEVWDEDRVVRRDAQFAAGGQTMSVAAIVHVPSGEMVAFNELLIGADREGVTHQWATLVTKEHRGTRLGTIVKCVNLLRWREIAPRSPKVTTFNAEENRHMLDINETIGFVAASYAGGWQKKLT